MNAGDKEILWVINKIIKKFKISRKGRVIRFDVSEKEENAPSYADQVEIIDKLKMFGIIKATRNNIHTGFDISPKDSQHDIVRIEILQPTFDKFILERYKIKNKNDNYIFSETYSQKNETDEEEFERVRTIKLDERNFILSINNGQRTIPFSSKRSTSEVEKETKQYKTLLYLWDFRRETKKGRVVREQAGDFESIANLKTASGSISEDATKRIISRLNELFSKKKVPIKIESRREKYRLTVIID